IPDIARALAVAIGVRGIAQGTQPASSVNVAAIAKDLAAHRGRSVVIAGDNQPLAVHALVHAINESLGNAGRTVVYIDPVEAAPIDQLQSIRDLTSAMNAGTVDIL